MSTKHDKTTQQLEQIRDQMIYDFDGVDNLLNFFLDNSTRTLDTYCQEHYNISYYYAKKIFEQMLNFPKKTHSTCQKYWKEHMIQTHIDKYGGVGYASEELSRKSHDTCEKLYGDRFYSNNKKSLETKLERYGTCYVNAEKIKKTSEDRYGGIGFASPVLRQKTKDTRLELYGDPNYHNVEQSLITCLERWGKDNYNNRQQMHETCLQRYGVPSYSQTTEFHKKLVSKYIYKNISFDSSWELAVWIYCEDHDKVIVRLPVRLTYTYEGKTHYYFPDFLIEDHLVEVKGNHLLDNGNLINMWDNSYSELENCKQQCMIDNNVLLVSSEDLKPVFQYIETTYGKEYLKTFKKEV